MKLAAAYNPSEHESHIYKLWEDKDAFAPREGAGEYFSMVVPPPNANADLHIGFGLTMAVEDTAARYNRLKGRATLFVPGADHAGFETQSVYEKQLAQEGKSRLDFSRETLYQQIWDFVAQNRSTFEKQFRQLGASVNWDKFTFTLDQKIVDQAYATFHKMWDEDLIYRGERLVNFCTFHGTAFADIEVEHRQEQGHLWQIAYPLIDGGEIVVATTRPETIFGDVAIAVHPTDEKYAHMIGKVAKVPLIGREIPIIADEAVDSGFGTGAVKVTPGHDQTDFEIGERHNLPKINVINPDGTLNHQAPEQLRGLDVKAGRQQTVELLKGQGLIRKTEGHTHSVGHCYKCDTVIQPLLREQWFVDMKPLAARAIKSLEAGEIKFYPDSKRRQLVRYLQGLRDWNISRQIAWGIPIPAFRSLDDDQQWIFDERVDQQIIEVKGKKYERDPDVFDTWFSSSSWPYATLDFPNGSDFEKYYPLSLMETGGEILYPWVARMIMLGLYQTGQVPFREVYIHGYVMAEDGSKMSKSVGNVVNASEVIAQYGSDALRMGLLAGRAPAVNRGYDSRRVEEARNFCNKLWNVARLIASKPAESKHEKSLADHWILNKLSNVLSEVDADFASYRFAEAYEKIYHFVWDDLADWYVEALKAGLASPKVAHEVLLDTLKLAHPIAPFVTEAIWQAVAADGSILASQLWPDATEAAPDQAQQFEELRQIISEVRRVAALLGIKSPSLHSQAQLSEAQKSVLLSLGKLSGLEVGQPVSGIPLNSRTPSWLAVNETMQHKYRQSMEENQTRLQDSIKLLEGRLGNQSYLGKAPKKLVEESRRQLEQDRAALKQIDSQLKSLA